MLFTTAVFALFFLPITLAGFYLLGRWQPRAAEAWLFVASVLFYGFWMPVFTLLLLASIGINFLLGTRLARSQGPARKRWLVAGIVLNLSLLAYFKYANFFVDNLNAVLGSHWAPGHVILPIGISFYTFTQIAFLVDTHARKVSEFDLVHYGLFVTYFPHLVAGPVLHHAQMMPQFAQASIYRWNAPQFAAGLAIFALGLVKKVVMADGVAPYADAVFKAADGGAMPAPSEAWLGALAYTLQLYFDFSGYSDMAIGLSWMFNVRLPFNFDSPYQARNISDFWRRWHISLSTFLRDYLYIALGGNRHGPVRRYANLLVTMLLGGLWHGAGWSFVLWGGLHGAYLMVNHGWRALCGPLRLQALEGSVLYRGLSWALTLLAVVLAWVFFRAETLQGALRIIHAMVGRGAGDALLHWNAGLPTAAGWTWCALLGALALVAPNSNTWGERCLGWLRGRPQHAPTVAGFAVASALMMVLINTARDSVSAFIYFNF